MLDAMGFLITLAKKNVAFAKENGDKAQVLKWTNRVKELECQQKEKGGK